VTGASPYAAAASTTGFQRTPAPIVATRAAGSTRRWSRRPVVISRPESIGASAPCPVPCTLTRMPADRANRTASTMSSTDVAVTTRSGRGANDRLKPAAAAANPSSPGS
jgi:hypothetical protein